MVPTNSAQSGVLGYVCGARIAGRLVASIYHRYVCLDSPLRFLIVAGSRVSLGIQRLYSIRLCLVIISIVHTALCGREKETHIPLPTKEQSHVEETVNG